MIRLKLQRFKAKLFEIVFTVNSQSKFHSGRGVEFNLKEKSGRIKSEKFIVRKEQ